MTKEFHYIYKKMIFFLVAKANEHFYIPIRQGTDFATIKAKINALQTPISDVSLTTLFDTKSKVEVEFD